MIDTLIVDGYNIIHAIPELEYNLDKSLKSARHALFMLLDKFRENERSIKHIYVVYDNKGTSDSGIEDFGIIKNIFASSYSNADLEIVDILKNLKKPSGTLVLSNDNFVINHTRVMGAHAISSSDFLKKIAPKINNKYRDKIDEETKRDINAEMKKIWGIE